MNLARSLRDIGREARRHGAWIRRRTTSRGGAGTDAGCLVCGGTRSAYEPLTFRDKPRLTREFSVCDACGYVAIKETTSDRYRGKTSLEELPVVGNRVGTEDSPGREFKMARMALDILGVRDVEVLVYGIGRSLDNLHIAAMRRVTNVAIADIMKVRDDAEFHDANQPATKRFPVVIASEVVEHFRRPHEDFAKLFQFVTNDGLLVCGTNVYDGGNLTRDRYPYYPDHTSYYTPQALREIARTNGFYLDFRTPRTAGATGRKRYVLFTRSPRVLERVSLYFGVHATAPSE